MEDLLKHHWHQVPIKEAAKLLNTDTENGLDIFEVNRRRESFGPNAIESRKGKSALQRFMLQFHQPLIYILLAAGVITAGLQEWVDSSVILAVVLVNAVIGYLQEAKALKALAALAQAMTTEATVQRSGQAQRIDARDLVPGDVVLLRSGDKVPADLRLVSIRELRVDESALTGESLPVQKSDILSAKDTPLADRLNMAYATSLVTYGTARGLVVATGSKTEIGRISELIAKADELQTPLTKKISQFSQLLLWIILALGAATFVAGLLRGQPLVETFMAVIALAVGAIPEGLPAAVTVILAIGVSRMARRKAIIRKLPAVETLGSTTVICTDKTGTLTENQMTVQEIAVHQARYATSGIGYDPSGAVTHQNGQAEETMLECLRCGLLCNDASLILKEGRFAVEGDPTEGALIVSARKAGLDSEQEAQRLPRIDAIPFESEHQYMATLHQYDGQTLAYAKGGLEAMLQRCDTYLTAQGESAPLDDTMRDYFVNQAEELASKGMRVLAFARKIFESGKKSIGHEDTASGLQLLGLQGMIDPPRLSAVQAVSACIKAGIKVKMITGDHGTTALAIAEKLGIAQQHPCEQRVLSGQQMASLSDQELIDEANCIHVFARVSPEQKLRLVEALQARDNVVAMTGDGVNDAPALKQANIGTAMGMAGTDVAKEASDIILTDDNFATIEAAVEEGRGVFDNLVKFIVWTIPTNLGEGLVILTAIFLGITLPILPVQILWINMTTAGTLGLMLAFEPKEAGIMSRPPRDPKLPIITRGLLVRILVVSGILLLSAYTLFKLELARGASMEEARTVAVNVFVMVEAFYLFNCRSLNHSPFSMGFFGNKWVIIGFLLMMALQAFYTYTPFMNTAFKSAPVGLLSWLEVLATGVAAFVIVELEKQFIYRTGISRRKKEKIPLN